MTFVLIIMIIQTLIVKIIIIITMMIITKIVIIMIIVKTIMIMMLDYDISIITNTKNNRNLFIAISHQQYILLSIMITEVNRFFFSSNVKIILFETFSKKKLSFFCCQIMSWIYYQLTLGSFPTQTN